MSTGCNKDDEPKSSYHVPNDTFGTSWVACNDIMDISVAASPRSTTTWWSQTRPRFRTAFELSFFSPQHDKKQDHKQEEEASRYHLEIHEVLLQTRTLSWRRKRPRPTGARRGRSYSSHQHNDHPAKQGKRTDPFKNNTRTFPEISSLSSIVMDNDNKNEEKGDDDLVFVPFPITSRKKFQNTSSNSTTFRNKKELNEHDLHLEDSDGHLDCSLSYDNTIKYHRDLLTDDQSMFNMQLTQFRVGRRAARRESSVPSPIARDP